MVSSERYLADLAPDAFAALLEQADPHQRKVLLRGRFRYDLEGFCRYLWPERFDLPFNALHESLFSRQDCEPWHKRRVTERDAVAAPRGFAKSTISSFALLVHAIVYDLEAYIVLLSAGQRLSFSLSRDLRYAFQDPTSRLAKLYGEFVVTGAVSEWEVSVRGRPSVGILAASFGSDIRGAKHPTRGIRPTLVVIDDGEKKDRVRNPDQRKVWWDFLTKDVLKLGRRQGGTRYWVRGTILHSDAMLARLMTAPGWRAERWRAIIRWPTNTKLWARCHEIWSDLELGEHRAAAARAFYEAHKPSMDAGAEVLGGLDNLYLLHEVLWAEGLASFLQELQNDPVDPSARIFEPEKWRRCVVDGDDVVVQGTGRRVPLGELRRVAWWDPTVGGPTGDYGAIAVLGRDRHGYTYVLDVWCRREKPDEQLAALWRLCATWGVREAWYESNGFQQLVARTFPRQRDDRRERGEFWQLQLLGETSSENKEERIAAMQPDTANGWLIFSTRLPPEVDQQAEAFPAASHDDALDAIERAWTKLGGAPIRMEGNPFAKAA